MPKEEEPSYSEYFTHNTTIGEVLSLFCGFLFTSLTILLTFVQDKEGLLVQTTIMFLTLIFFFALYVLLDNLEMPFHYIRNIPPLTLKVRPFFYLLLIFYLFGSSIILMLLLFNLVNLAIISSIIWTLLIIASINSTAKRFYKQASKRTWTKENLREHN